jgi:hypothetical protein
MVISSARRCLAAQVGNPGDWVSTMLREVARVLEEVKKILAVVPEEMGLVFD